MTDVAHEVPTQATAKEAKQGLGRAWFGLLTLTLASFAGVTTEMLPVGLLPRIGDAFHLSDSTVGLLISLYAIMVAVLAVPLTLATARLPRKPLLLATIALYVVSNVIVALAPNVGVLAAGRVLGGITHALFFSVCIGYATRLVPTEFMGRALAIASAGISAGFVLGVPVGVSIGTAVGWRWAFAAVAVCTAIAFVLAAAVLPAVAAVVPSGGSGRRDRSRSMAAAITSNFLTYLGHYTLYTYVSVLLLRSGAVPTAIGPLLLLFGAVGLGGLTLAARQLDTRPRVSALVVVGVIVAGIAAVGAGYPTLAAVIAAAVVWNTGFGPVSSVYQSAAVRTRATSPDVAGAWVNSSSNVGIAAAAALGGAILDGVGLDAVAWTAAGLVAAALLVIVCARRAFPARG